MTAKNIRRQHVRQQAGLSLIELMVAMLIGLLVVGAAVGIFLSNRQVYRATEGVGRLQEGTRVAFELMSRDLREAAGNPCVNNLPVANVLNNFGSNWWSNIQSWGDAFRGYGAGEAAAGLVTGTGAGQRVAGTEALQLFSADDNVVTVSAHDTAGATFSVNSGNHGIGAGDLALVCNGKQASIFQVSSVDGTGTNISHAVSAGTPGNARIGLNVDGVSNFNYSPGAVAGSESVSVLARLRVSRWYIGNGGNGPSLYQQVATANGNVATQEVAEGVSNLSVLYLVDGQSVYQGGAAVGGNWGSVTSARITLTLAGNDRVGPNGQTIQRQLIHVVSLRNRNP
ncbi:prepilin-type N-terminal cleavage/methylation domain-containing protein [Stenotrophomonas sp. NLF4-10]|uniref:prepilin-type N-terminal cleavage/methylation domain-containing protein n=1 Tax=Stenotrophomonas sp. NLF4-10 TaxID=2918754 RepID=UPI001EFA4272|nr:prepilin-type N-terminal cleavage/methylation domain-containing protein [Stenotrophomonas sp. NLF4-10]MCG8276165.1 prepilin-type N-terminal cleavage/methylation domain-containing protein [Stenotrophomonas sp. NLF4-10]